MGVGSWEREEGPESALPVLWGPREVFSSIADVLGVSAEVRFDGGFFDGGRVECVGEGPFWSCLGRRVIRLGTDIFEGVRGIFIGK